MFRVGQMVTVKKALGIRRIAGAMTITSESKCFGEVGEVRVPLSEDASLLINHEMLSYAGRTFNIVSSDVVAPSGKMIFRLGGIEDWAWTEECFKKSTEKQPCSKCGKESKDIVLHDGVIYCKECFDELFVLCENCGKYERKSRIVTVDGNKNWCHNCAVDYSRICDDCGERVSHTTRVDGGDDICDSCRDENYVRCPECGNYFKEDDVNDTEYGRMCSRCFDRREGNVINSYDYRPNPTFFGESDSRFFGVELEMEFEDTDEQPDDECKAIIKQDGVKGHAYWKHDGSLGDSGAEFVTHPHSLAEHSAGLWKLVCDKAVQQGGRSHNTSTCGLHVHVNRNSLGSSDEEIADTVANAMIIMHENWNDIVKFSRRKGDELEQWANNPIERMESDYRDSDCYDSDRKLKKDTVKRYCRNTGNRYQAINVQNRNTIEFRIFKGSLKVNTVLASIQLVDIICELAKTLEDDSVYDVDFNSFIATAEEKGYTEFVEYCKTREIV